MEQDARRLRDGTVLEADLCIVGAGPAGITLAREFIGEKFSVVILESGGPHRDEAIQQLSEGAVVGDSYAGLRQTRYRAVGGTAVLWNTRVSDGAGAKYVPLDPPDFEARGDFPDSGWPFDCAHLAPFYRRAQCVCGLGPFVYESAYWADGGPSPHLLDSEHLASKVYQLGSGDLFTVSHPRAVCGSPNVSLYHHATVCGLETDKAGKRAAEANVACLSGTRFRVRARIFVLAGGAIENARLLLLSGGADSGGLGNRHDWLGRCFMEHPRDYALTLLPRSSRLFESAAFYDAHPAHDGTIVAGRIALAERTIRNYRLPNASITLLARARSGWTWLRRLITGTPRPGYPTAGYGWSQVPDASRAFDAFRLLVNVEQRPHPENRIVLVRARDRLGIPRVEVRWRWRQEEQALLDRLRELVARELEAAGLGRVVTEKAVRPNPDAHHHAGTTRMHDDSRGGVVDRDARVHDTENVYVAGASVFPTTGFANPTLTVVALTLRLADHLKERM